MKKNEFQNLVTVSLRKEEENSFFISKYAYQSQAWKILIRNNITKVIVDMQITNIYAEKKAKTKFYLQRMSNYMIRY